MAAPIRKSDAARNLRHPLGVEPGLGRFREEPDHGAHVVQMMRQLILTDFGERVMRSEFGTGVKMMLFGGVRGVSETLVRAAVRNALETWLGDLITVEAIAVSEEEETLRIRIIYALRSVPGRRILNLEVAV